MSIYSLALFVHIISDITLFIGIGGQLLVLFTLRRARDMSQVSNVVGLIRITDGMGVLGALFTILSGFYMARTVWGIETSWIVVALGSILLIIGPLIGAVIKPRTRSLVKIAKDVQQASPIPPALWARIHDPLLGAALQTNLAVGIGIVFLMTNKPSLTVSVITMITALALGVVSGFPLWVATRRTRLS
jgi:uncharacterized membrane protein